MNQLIGTLSWNGLPRHSLSILAKMAPVLSGTRRFLPGTAQIPSKILFIFLLFAPIKTEKAEILCAVCLQLGKSHRCLVLGHVQYIVDDVAACARWQ